MGGLGSHMVGLTQLRVLEIYHTPTFTADGPVWPAGGAAERAELGCGAPGASYTSTAGLYVLVHVTQRDRAAWERS